MHSSDIHSNFWRKGSIHSFKKESMMVKRSILGIVFSLLLMSVFSKASEPNYIPQEIYNIEVIRLMFFELAKNGYTKEIIEQFYSPDCTVRRNHKTYTYQELLQLASNPKEYDVKTFNVEKIFAKRDFVGVWYTITQLIKENVVSKSIIRIENERFCTTSRKRSYRHSQ